MRALPSLPYPACTCFYNGVVLALAGPFALVALQNQKGKIFRWIGRRFLQEAGAFEQGDRITMTFNSPFGPTPGTSQITKVTLPPVPNPWAREVFGLKTYSQT